MKYENAVVQVFYAGQCSIHVAVTLCTNLLGVLFITQAQEGRATRTALQI